MFEPVYSRMAEALERIARASEKLAAIEAPAPRPQKVHESWASLPVGPLWVWLAGFDVDDPDANWFFRFSSRRLEGETLPPRVEREDW